MYTYLRYQSPAYPISYGLVIFSILARLNSVNWRMCKLSCATQEANIVPAFIEPNLDVKVVFQSAFFSFFNQANDFPRSVKNFLCIDLKFCWLYFRNLTQANGEIGCHFSC